MQVEVFVKTESDGQHFEEAAGTVVFPGRPMEGDVVGLGSQAGVVEKVAWHITHGKDSVYASCRITVRFY